MKHQRGHQSERQSEHHSEYHSEYHRGLGAVGLDVPGIVRRVRRLLRVSQRELADRLGVAPGTVGRWESGTREPALSMFTRLLELAGLRPTIIAADDVAVEPMGGPETVRDRVGRWFPAHLDVVAASAWAIALGRGGSEDQPVARSVGRRRRDVLSLAQLCDLIGGGQPPLAAQHPTEQELRAQLAEKRERFRERVRAHARRLTARHRPEVEPEEGAGPWPWHDTDEPQEWDELDEVDQLHERDEHGD
ncbi:helix-turn-helix domain-containing protein [Aestuariimicrobium ganziense]|uniref:helix-turn-helix domain-containing protein n=1 Tax=Aestuariimicrobium ganziense TaxID=2773677 RepID=UPI001943781E|nr:helix-turn-helix transcriptional regulator [Aestuariimicrobium ganziense]